ncbi:hypothetical protein HY493_03830 [Candidatus Woesearchaeota archaeon]|nr:hypothetical protein [Candidatus Woesearchaeota archaeon]
MDQKQREMKIRQYPISVHDSIARDTEYEDLREFSREVFSREGSSSSAQYRLPSVSPKELKCFMPLIYDAFQVARAVSIDEILTLRDDGMKIHESVLYSSIEHVGYVIRGYLAGQKASHADLEDVMRVIQLAQGIKSATTEDQFGTIVRKAFGKQPKNK